MFTLDNSRGCRSCADVPLEIRPLVDVQPMRQRCYDATLWEQRGCVGGQGQGVDKTLHLVAVYIQFMLTACTHSGLDRRGGASEERCRESAILNRSKSEEMLVHCHVRRDVAFESDAARKEPACIPAQAAQAQRQCIDKYAVRRRDLGISDGVGWHSTHVDFLVNALSEVNQLYP
jgi:hypothetical protein